MSRNVTKHRQILETLENRIQSGRFQPGDRLPSDAELVREFGVSRPTVARAVGELERRGVVRRRRGSGTYVQKPIATDQMFGLLIPGLGSTEIFEPICGEMAQMAQQEQHGLLWGGSTLSRLTGPGELGPNAIEICRQYIQKGVSGVFFAPLELTANQDQVNREIVELLSGADIPVVLLDRDYTPYPDRSRFDLVGIDNRRVGHMITSHLHARGCRRIAFIARPHSASTIDARIAGFTEAVLQFDGAFDPALVQRCEPRDKEAIGRVLRDLEPEGIVCGNDVTAAHVMHALDELGVQVPADVLVAGIDDVKYAELLRVPLTTVHQPCAAIGRAAYSAMLDRIATPDLPARDILLSCSIVERGSTRRER